MKLTQAAKSSLSVFDFPYALIGFFLIETDNPSEALFFRGDRSGAEGFFCQVETNTNGESVCVTSDDATGVSGLLLAFYVPGLVLFDFAAESNFSISMEDDREIVDLRATCYRFEENSADSGSAPEEPSIGCFGPSGEPLYHLAHYGRDTLEFTAVGVRTDVDESDIEVPYPIVEATIVP